MLKTFHVLASDPAPSGNRLLVFSAIAAVTVLFVWLFLRSADAKKRAGQWGATEQQRFIRTLVAISGVFFATQILAAILIH